MKSPTSRVRTEAHALLVLRRALRAADRRQQQAERAANARRLLRGPRWRGVEWQAREGQTEARAPQHGPSARKASFWHEIGPPPLCRPADFMAAKLFERKVLELLDRGGWPKIEYITLRKLAVKWGRRARGEDFRFILAGTAPGRMPRVLEDEVRAVRILQATRGEKG